MKNYVFSVVLFCPQMTTVNLTVIFVFFGKTLSWPSAFFSCEFRCSVSILDAVLLSYYQVNWQKSKHNTWYSVHNYYSVDGAWRSLDGKVVSVEVLRFVAKLFAAAILLWSSPTVISISSVRRSLGPLFSRRPARAVVRWIPRQTLAHLFRFDVSSGPTSKRAEAKPHATA